VPGQQQGDREPARRHDVREQPGAAVGRGPQPERAEPGQHRRREHPGHRPAAAARDLVEPQPQQPVHDRDREACEQRRQPLRGEHPTQRGVHRQQQKSRTRREADVADQSVEKLLRADAELSRGLLRRN
jgi:hypothetical protein